MRGVAGTTHTWRCTEVHKIHLLRLLPRRKGRFPQATTGLVIKTTAGLRSASRQLIQSPAEANKNFHYCISMWVAKATCTCWRCSEVRDWQDQTPIASHRSRATLSNGASWFLQPLVFPETPRKATCALLVLQNKFPSQSVWSWSRLQTMLAKGLSTFSLRTGACTEEPGIHWPKEVRESIFNVVN